MESLNNRHNKNRYGSKTLSRNNRTDNKKKGRDEEKEDYTGASNNKKEKDKDADDKGGHTAVIATSKDNSTGKVNPDKVKSECIGYSCPYLNVLRRNSSR